MPVNLEDYPVRRRLIVSVPPNVRWSHMEKAVLDAVQRAPELTGWDWIIDDQGPIDDVDVAGMARIGEVFRALAVGPAHATHTVVVTTDPFFGPWAQVMDHHYGGRRHHGAPTLQAALSLLDRLQSQNAKRDSAESRRVGNAAVSSSGPGLR